MYIYIQLFLPERFPFRSGTPSRSHSLHCYPTNSLYIYNVYIYLLYLQLFFLPERFPFRSGTPSRSHSPHPASASLLPCQWPPAFPSAVSGGSSHPIRYRRG